MQRTALGADTFKWPDKADKLNTLREDVLFVCDAPKPAVCSSSSRSITYSLSKSEIKKANMLLNKAYYHTKFVYNFMVLLFILLLSNVGANRVKMVLIWCDNKSNF
jgi:hypothetical protein